MRTTEQEGHNHDKEQKKTKVRIEVDRRGIKTRANLEGSWIKELSEWTNVLMILQQMSSFRCMRTTTDEKGINAR
jgi:hypothetical protein